MPEKQPLESHPFVLYLLLKIIILAIFTATKQSFSHVEYFAREQLPPVFLARRLIQLLPSSALSSS